MTGKIRRNGISQEDDNERISKIISSRSLGKNNLSSIYPSKTKSLVDSDFNGDGKNDVFINDPNGRCQIWYYSAGKMNNLLDITYLYGALSSDVLCADFDGDGLLDLWSIEDTILNIYHMSSTGELSPLYSTNLCTSHNYFILGDFNGDGKTDLFIYGYKDSNGTEYDWPNWKILLSTGSGFEEHDVPQKKANLIDDYVRTGDFNGDGANDIMVTSKDFSWAGCYFYISENNGTNFYPSYLPDYPIPSHNFYLADYDGDGQTDFICTDGVSPFWTGYQVYRTTGNTSILMNKVSNGLGLLTKINYTKLSQAPASIYIRDTTATFPVMDFQGPWSVVSSVQVDNGKGSLNTQNYFYEGAKVHLKGKGFIEFAKTSVTDLTTGIETGNVNSYNASYAYPVYYFYPTLIKSYSRTIGTGDTIETVKNRWSQVVLDGYERRVFPYIQSSTQLNKLTGLSITSTAQYDFYGNPTSIVKNYLNGPTETTITNYDNTISSSLWLLGRPTSTSVQYTGSSPTITRQGTKTFDFNNNHLLSETWFSGTGNEITKTYVYNSNGTFQSETATAGSVSRSNSCTYMSDNIRIYTSTDQLSHVNTNAYDSYGRLYTQQDYLGNTATYLYDDLGRTSSVSLSDGSQATTVYAWENPTSDPVNARYSVQKTGNDGSQTESWFDKLGREIRSGVKGFDGTMIYTTTVYNTLGQVESVTDPYYSNGTGLLNTFLYDSYGRKTSLTRPSGRNTTWAYNNSTTTETTAGKSFSKTYSSDGTISAATDAGGTINYTYYNDGKVKSITAPGGITTSMQYDPAGNQNQLVDPSAGTTSYTYNGFGELTYQQNAKAQTTQLTYYDDGRPNQKILSLEGTTTFSYNSNKQLTGISSPGSVSRSIGYDTEGRVTSRTETIPGSSAFITTIAYDDKGRIRKITHPSNIIETKHYNQNGYLDSISTNNVVRWTTTAMNARQQVTSGQYWQTGGNLNASFGYNTIDGSPTSTVVGTIQNYSYNFDPVTGNLSSRQNQKYTGLSESFQYDNLDRLSNVHMDTTLILNMAYDSNKGGITTKSDAGTFTYDDPDHTYAISSVNQTDSLIRTSQSITYTSFESVSTISENNYNASFIYNSDNQRAQMIVKQGSSTILTRWYPTGSYIKETSGSVTNEYTFIGGDSYSAPIVAITQSGTTTYYNILRDYLGNITHVVNATTGAVTAEYSYDAWGRMRNPSTWVNYAPGSEPALFVAGRGFTGHEHLPWFNLINMNGRVYDALLGMFLSADNYVQNPGLTQNFNRYEYCLNNPLKYTDPSGFLSEAEWDAVESFWNQMVTHPDQVPSGSYSLSDMVGGGGGGGVTPGSGFQGPGLPYMLGEVTVAAKAPVKNTPYSPIIYNNENQFQFENATYNPFQFENAHTGGGGNTLEKIKVGFEVGKLTSEAAKELGFIATIGTNLRPYVSGWAGNQYVSTIGLAKSAVNICFWAGAASDATLYFLGEQSGAKTAASLGVNGLAFYLGGVPGIILGGGYMLVDKTVGWERMLTPVSNDKWVPNRAVFPDGTTIYVCFKAGTQICTKDGFKPIERIAIGDSVYSYNLDKSTIELSKVVKSFERKTQEIYELTTDSQKVYVTAEHPFYVEGKGWIKVRDLQVGFGLKTKGGSKEYIINITISKHTETVYNIEVEGNHNYFVTNSSILVHNK